MLYSQMCSIWMWFIRKDSNPNRNREKSVPYVKSMLNLLASLNVAVLPNPNVSNPNKNSFGTNMFGLTKFDCTWYGQSFLRGYVQEIQADVKAARFILVYPLNERLERSNGENHWCTDLWGCYSKTISVMLCLIAVIPAWTRESLDSWVPINTTSLKLVEVLPEVVRPLRKGILKKENTLGSTLWTKSEHILRWKSYKQPREWCKVVKKLVLVTLRPWIRGGLWRGLECIMTICWPQWNETCH